MERRVRGNAHARCGGGEKAEERFQSLTYSDQYGAASDWSEQTWLYINRAPIVSIRWLPQPAFEGDEIRLIGEAYDPDGDPLQYAWRIRGPGYEASDTRVETSIPAAATDGHPGEWEASLVVTDPYGLSAEAVQKIPVGDLQLKGFVSHTDLWESYRRKYNTEVSGDPERPRPADMFWAGETFVLRADTNEPAAQVTAEMSYTEMTTGLQPAAGAKHWRGDAHRDDFERLPDGAYRFVFTSQWPNGHIEQDTVTVTVKGGWTEYTESVRKE